MVPMSERFEMRLDEETLDRIDGWADQQGLSSRAEAVRQLIEAGLTRSSSEAVHLSDGEKLSLWLLTDLVRGLNVSSELDPRFIQNVIAGGHHWALSWEYPGIYEAREDRPQDLKLVLEILDMWNFIERGYDELSEAEKKSVQARATDWVTEDIRFPGFDGNYETSLLGIARFLIKDLGRFSRFEGRDLNSHMPLRDRYDRMLTVFRRLKTRLIGEELDAEQIVQVIGAKEYTV